MKSEVFNAHYKYRILKHAMKEKNVSRTCQLFGISRATFYNWYRAYTKHGFSGLELKEPQKPTMPNKVSIEMERRILSYVVQFPADGPKRIYYELKSDGLLIGESGIYNVLKRNSLTTKAGRIAYSKENTHDRNVVTARVENDAKYEQYMSAYPGHRVIQRIDFMGTFDGIGKIYQYSVIDTFSHWGIVKLYNRKRDIDVWDFFEVKLVYLMKIFNLNIDKLFTVKTKAFISFFVSGDKYQDILETFNIDHQFISHEHESPQMSKAAETLKSLESLETLESLDSLESFNRMLLKDFYGKIGSEIQYESFAQVERAMNKFVRHINFSNAISTGNNTGKTPAEVVLEFAKANKVDLDTLPLWLMAVINAPRHITREHALHESLSRVDVTHEGVTHESVTQGGLEQVARNLETNDEEK
jgi:transposase-like protein